VRGRVGSEAAPNYERRRTISGQTNPPTSQPPPSSADTNVRWDLPCPSTWQGVVRGFPGGWGAIAGPGAPLLVGVEGPTAPVGYGAKPRAAFCEIGSSRRACPPAVSITRLCALASWRAGKFFSFGSENPLLPIIHSDWICS
jgi:hypothetical protein